MGAAIGPRHFVDMERTAASVESWMIRGSFTRQSTLSYISKYTKLKNHANREEKINKCLKALCKIYATFNGLGNGRDY